MKTPSHAVGSRSNIVVMADEAHRTQYGFEAKLKTVKAKPQAALSVQAAANDGQQLQVAEPARSTPSRYQVGYAQHLRDALPQRHLCRFHRHAGFSEDRDTRAVFGDYIHVYDMQQAKEDGATVAIYFESRLARLSLKRESCRP